MTKTVERTLITGIALILAASVATAVALAQAPLGGGNLDTPGTNRTLELPEAADNADVISLGSAVDPTTGKTVEGYAFFHHKDGHDKGGGPGGNDGSGDTTSSCYAFFDKFTSWKSVEEYAVNPTNTVGLDETYIRDTLATSMNDWEAAAGTEIFGSPGAGEVDGVDSSSPDGKNEVLFGDIASSGAIGVTVVWGTFNGPPSQREIIEWDQMYDQVDFAWSQDGSTSTMDFHNIAAHELGHSIGLGHPDSTCTEETMYAYATEGETKKRDLNDGDIAGAAELY